MVKHIDHISRSVYLEIRRISSIRHLLTTKATAQLMCSFVLSRLDDCNSLLIGINCEQMYRLKKVQNHAAKFCFCFLLLLLFVCLLLLLLFAVRADMSMLDQCSRHLTGCQSKTGLVLRQPLLFSVVCVCVCVFPDGTLPTCLESCLSVYTPSRTHFFPPGDAPHVYVRSATLRCFYSLISTQTFRRLNKYIMDPADIKAAHQKIISKSPGLRNRPDKSYCVFVLKATVRINRQKPTDLTGLSPRPTVLELYCHHGL